MKDGKILVSDRDKYRQLTTQQGDVFTVPEVLMKAFNDAGLVYKWVGKAKVASSGGYHPSGWIPYEISAEQKASLPAVGLGTVVTNRLERGDMILAVKPKENQAEHRQYVEQKTKRQLDAYHSEVDAKGKKILRNDEE